MQIDRNNASLPEEVRDYMGLDLKDSVVAWTTKVDRSLVCSLVNGCVCDCLYDLQFSLPYEIRKCKPQMVCYLFPPILAHGLLFCTLVIAPSAIYEWCQLFHLRYDEGKYARTYLVYTERGHLLKVLLPHSSGAIGGVWRVSVPPCFQLREVQVPALESCFCGGDLHVYDRVESSGDHQYESDHALFGYGMSDLPEFDKTIRTHAKGLVDSGSTDPFALALAGDVIAGDDIFDNMLELPHEPLNADAREVPKGRLYTWNGRERFW